MPIKINKNIDLTFGYQATDFTTDKKYNLIQVTDSEGKVLYLDQWIYAIDFYMLYFEPKVKLKDGTFYLKEYPLPSFINLTMKNSKFIANDIIKFMNEFSCTGLQLEFCRKYDMPLNRAALYSLGSYLRKVINTSMVLLLKPKISDTLNELKAKKIHSVTFNTFDGKHITSDYESLLDIIKKSLQDNLKEENDETYGFHKVVHAVDIYKKEYGQILFTRYLSDFFHDFFKIKRRTNSYLTIIEQNIICFMLKFFGFTPEIVQESRIRQLRNAPFREINSFFNLSLPGIMKSNITIDLPIMPYSVWKDMPIDTMSLPKMFDDDNKTQKPKVMHLHFGESPDISILDNYLKEVFDNLHLE